MVKVVAKPEAVVRPEASVTAESSNVVLVVEEVVVLVVKDFAKVLPVKGPRGCCGCGCGAGAGADAGGGPVKLAGIVLGALVDVAVVLDLVKVSVIVLGVLVEVGEFARCTGSKLSPIVLGRSRPLGSLSP